MARSLSPSDAAAYIATGEVDVVDVRNPDEFARGHIPGARNVPLDDFKADPKEKLPRDKILFVCARGLRSQSAAALAAQIGFRDVANLDGGTNAWIGAGLPIETPAIAHLPTPSATLRLGARSESDPRAEAQSRRDSATAPAPANANSDSNSNFPATAPATAPAPARPPKNATCGLPEPALDAVVGANLRALRTERNLSLDELAREAGLSRNLLGQIELGKTAPSVSVVWKIARVFDVPFSALLATAEPAQASVLLRRAEAKRLVSPDGRFSSRALYVPGARTHVEFYELFLAAQSREDAQPHRAGTRENLIVARGRLELDVADAHFELATGDAIVFSADVPHSYVNPANDECWLYLVMTYVTTGS